MLDEVAGDCTISVERHDPHHRESFQRNLRLTIDVAPVNQRYEHHARVSQSMVVESSARIRIQPRIDAIADAGSGRTDVIAGVGQKLISHGGQPWITVLNVGFIYTVARPAQGERVPVACAELPFF